MAIEGDTIVAGALFDDVAGLNNNEGSAYTFARTGGDRTQTAKLTASDGGVTDFLGSAVAIEGDTIVVGAAGDTIGSNDDQGSAYTFARTGGDRTQTAKLTASDGSAHDELGRSVGLDGDTIVAGAPFHNVSVNGDQGAAYTFARTGADRAQIAELTASDGAAGDLLGRSVDIDGDTIVAGAPRHDIDASTTDAGFAYTFARTGGDRTEAAKLTAPDARIGDELGTSVAIDGDTIVAGVPSDRSPDTLLEIGSALISFAGQPAATDDDATVFEDSPASLLDVLANDTDPEGDPFEITSVSDPAHGTASVVEGSPDRVSYTPDRDYCNEPGPAPTDDLIYTLDGGDTATVAVTVICVAEVSSGAGGVGAGGRVISGTPGADTINGTPGDDVINCGAGDDVVNGGAGNDIINCGAGDDRVSGNAGNDIVRGEAGNDSLSGDEGNDAVLGDKGNDTINGGTGDDWLWGSTGNDRVAGQSGDDRLAGDSGRDRVSGGSGNDVVSGGTGNDRSNGSSGRDRVSGGAGKDLLWGRAGKDRLAGGSGNDRLAGGSGNDRLAGGPGNDRLAGGPGRDRLDGGPGTDRARQ